MLEQQHENEHSAIQLFLVGDACSWLNLFRETYLQPTIRISFKDPYVLMFWPGSFTVQYKASSSRTSFLGIPGLIPFLIFTYHHRFMCIASLKTHLKIPVAPIVLSESNQRRP